MYLPVHIVKVVLYALKVSALFVSFSTWVTIERKGNNFLVTTPVECVMSAGGVYNLFLPPGWKLIICSQWELNTFLSCQNQIVKKG